MKYRLVIQEEARREVIEAFVWYEEQQPDMGEDFLQVLDECYFRILSQPESCRKVYKNYRQLVVKWFPFVVIYEIEDSAIVVYSVFHTSRDPAEKFPVK